MNIRIYKKTLEIDTYNLIKIIYDPVNYKKWINEYNPSKKIIRIEIILEGD